MFAAAGAVLVLLLVATIAVASRSPQWTTALAGCAWHSALLLVGEVPWPVMVDTLWQGFIPASISCRYSLWTILRCLLRTICICAHRTGGSNNDILARQWAGHVVCHYHGDSFPLTCFAHPSSLCHCLKTPARTDPPYWPGHGLHAHRPGYPPDTTGSTHVRPLKKKKSF